MSDAGASNQSMNTLNRKRQGFSTSVAAFLTILLAGCEPGDDPNQNTVIIPIQPEMPVAWHVLDDALVVSLSEEAIDDELRAAMDVALASADEERENWRFSSNEQKRRWAIKWGASTADGRIEYVWVRPLAWSQYRIEGVLANSPQNELTCGKIRGDLVSFPVEELADWIRFLSDDFNGPYEGGYTLEVLTNRYGTPTSGN